MRGNQVEGLRTQASGDSTAFQTSPHGSAGLEFRPRGRRRIEFCGDSPYSKRADEFVRLSCRGYAGWRRDEWAYSPLFIWRVFAQLGPIVFCGFWYQLLDFGTDFK